MFFLKFKTSSSLFLGYILKYILPVTNDAASSIILYVLAVIVISIFGGSVSDIVFIVLLSPMSVQERPPPYAPHPDSDKKSN